MIGVHMRDDLRLGRGQRGGIGGKAQSLALDPGDAAEPGDQMAALDRDAVEVKIGEPGVDGARGVPRGEAGREARIVDALGAPEQRSAAARRADRHSRQSPRTAARRAARPARLLRVLCEVGQQQQRAGIDVAGDRDQRDVGPSVEAGGQRRVIARADQAPGLGRALRQVVIHDAYSSIRRGHAAIEIASSQQAKVTPIVDARSIAERCIAELAET